MKSQVAKALLEVGAVGFSPDSPITFTSGIRSPVYVDNRVLVYHPKAWHIIVGSFRYLIDSYGLKYDVIAGVATGGVPHSSALAYILKKPSVFIRKESKAHGKGKRIEGGDVAGRRVLLVEDHVTTGGSSLDAISVLRKSGAHVSDVLAIISYGFSEVLTSFEKRQLELHTLTDFTTLIGLARCRNDITEKEVAIVREWFADPHAWEPGA